MTGNHRVRRAGRARKDRMLKAYRSLLHSEGFGSYFGWGEDTDRILSEYPELSTAEAIFIGAFLSRGYREDAFTQALGELGIN